MAARAPIDLDELVGHWTVLEDERALVDGKRGATRLGFALLLKFYRRHGRFPAGGAELLGAVVEFVARQVGVGPSVGVERKRVVSGGVGGLERRLVSGRVLADWVPLVLWSV